MNIAAIETSRLQRQIQLDAMKNAFERNKLGQFATPPALALQIVQFLQSIWSAESNRIRFIDPAIGTGAFYGALRSVFRNDDIEKAVGIEVDAAFVRTAEELWKSTGLELIHGDFTAQAPPPLNARFNLVLTNPPYSRHHHLPAEQKARLKAAVGKTTGLEISGLAGLYAHFMLLAHEWLEDDGLGVWLVPSEFMNVNYGAAIQAYLTRHVKLLRIHRFCPSDVQFCDALVTSAIVVFQKSTPTPAHKAAFTFGGSILEPELVEHVPISSLRARSKWTAFPRRPENGTRTKPDDVTLGQLFTIKRGLATGSNGFFIRPRHEALDLGIPDEALRPILPSPRYLPEIIIEKDRDGWPAIPTPLALIDSALPEDVIRQRFPGFWRYLQAGIEREVHKGYLASRRSPWYSQENRSPAPFLCTYMGRNRNGAKPFRFLWNKSDATAANVYLLLYPKPHLKTVLDNHPGLTASVFEGLQEIEPDNFIAEGRVYGGGLHKVEPKELAALSAQTIVERINVMPPKQEAFCFSTPI